MYPIFPSTYNLLKEDKLILITDFCDIQNNFVIYCLLEDCGIEHKNIKMGGLYDLSVNCNFKLKQSCLCHLRGIVTGFVHTESEEHLKVWIKENQEFYDYVLSLNKKLQCVLTS